MRGGYYYYGNGSLNYQSNYGYYWSRLPLDNATDGYHLSFRSGLVYPQGSNNRNNGFPLRCLAR